MTIGYITLDVGEQALIYNHAGSARIEDGPKRIFLFRERLQRLSRYSADQKQYLIIKYRDGRVEHRKGPCVLYKNPIAHSNVTVMKMMSLDANEALVIYHQDEKTKEVTRNVQFGPTLFMPHSNEWIHQFSWHGTDPNNKTRVIPNANQFETLKIIPDQFYYNVADVRLKDDAAISVKLMIFYELKDIDTMLNATKDPIADMVNCVCADVIAFASKYSYVEFMEKAAMLNDLDYFPQLAERCKVIGYLVSKIVYRGYHAHSKLQELHDTATQTRTNLKIQYESEEQKQDMTDLELQNKRKRKELEQKLQIQELNHKFALEKSKMKHELSLDLEKEQEKYKQLKLNKDAEIRGKQVLEEEKVKHYSQLKDLSVDLDEYINALHARPNKLIKVVTERNSTNFHLHRS